LTHARHGMFHKQEDIYTLPGNKRRIIKMEFVDPPHQQIAHYRRA
jgi:hypothetical protein